MSSFVSLLALLVGLPRLTLAGCHSDEDCYYNGQCLSSGQCQCDKGYGGQYCEYYCGYCYNGGTCVGYYGCLCTAGYTGASCRDTLHSVIKVCSEVCQNGGTCFRGECVCSSDYHGDYCQYPPPPSGSTMGFIISTVLGGVLVFGCCVFFVCIRVWMRSRRLARLRSQQSAIATNGRRIILVSLNTEAEARPPDAPPPYMSSDPKPHTENCSTLPPGSELTTPTPGPTPPYPSPTPPYSGPSPLYTGPSPPETGITPPNLGPTLPYSGPTPPYSGPSPSYPGPNQSSCEATVPEEDNVGDDVPLLPGN